MGSKRFYEHAQNLLGDVKKEVGNNRTKEEKGMLLKLRKNKLCYVNSILL